MITYQPGIIYERTPEEYADPFLSWAREDKAFFASGACHILADMFLQLHFGQGFERIHIKPRNNAPGNHVYVTNGTWAFDFNGWTKEAELLEAYEKAYVAKHPGWKYDRVVVKDDLEAFCKNNNHRLPWQFPYLPWERAYKYIKQFDALAPKGMEKRTIGQTKNGKAVYVDMQGSHAATHIKDTPKLLELVQELIVSLVPTEDNIYVDKDMRRQVGLSDLVGTNETDKILYAKRLNRDNYTRFVQNRKAGPTNFVTVVLRKDPEGNYELWSAWIGRAAPQFPGDEHETPDSRAFWQTHALVWGNQEIQPNTEREDWPWD